MAQPKIAVHLTSVTAGFQKGFKEATGALKGFGATLKSVATFAAGQIVARAFIGMFRKVTQLGKGFIMSAARVGEMTGVLRHLGEAHGYTSKQMDDFVESVREVGVRASVAQDLISQFIKAELDLAQAADIAKVALDAGVYAFADSSETLARLTYGIATHNTLVLRTAGVMINAQQAYTEYGKTIGKTAKQLTEAEKTQAMMNAVLKEGENIAGTYDAAMAEPAKLLRSFPRYFEDIGIAVGKSFIKPFGQALFTAKEFTKALQTAVSEGGSLAPALEKLGQIAADLMGNLVKWAELWLEKLPQTEEEFEAVATSIEGFKQSIKDTGDAVVLFAADVAGVFNVLRHGFRALHAQAEAWGEFMLGLFPALGDGVTALASGFQGIGAAIQGNREEALDYLQTMYDSFGRMRDYVSSVAQHQVDAFAAAGTAVNDAFGEGQQAVMERFWRTATDEAEQSAQDMARAVDAAAARIELANQEMAEKIEEINTEVQQKIAAITVRETWKAIDAQIAAQRKLIDEERATAKRRAQIQQQFTAAMAQAQAQYSAATTQAARDRGERLADIEYEYQKRLRDIQRNYQQSAEEAIRNRDARALMEAGRQRDRELQEAGEARDEQNAEAQSQYQKQLEQAQMALQQQEEAAREGLRKQQEELAAALAERAEEERIAEQRAAEDAERARAREMGAIRTWQGQVLGEAMTAHQAELTELQLHHGKMLAERNRYLAAFGVRPSGRTSVQEMQYGGSGIVTQPTVFVAGEAGPERYSFTPLGGGGGFSGGAGGSRMTVNQNLNFSGPIGADQMTQLREMMREASEEAVAGMLGG